MRHGVEAPRQYRAVVARAARMAGLNDRLARCVKGNYGGLFLPDRTSGQIGATDHEAELPPMRDLTLEYPEIND